MTDPAPQDAPLSTPLLVLVSLATDGAFLCCLHLVAGRWDLPWFWATVGTMATTRVVLVLTVFRRDPGLARERLRPGKKNSPAWDRAVLGVSALLLLAGVVLSALDAGRFHWSDTVPLALRAAGLVGLAAGMGIMGWAMRANTFFSKVVRIQDERGHHVVDVGPYRLVRHPGYVGWFLLWLGFNLGLGSWLAVLVALAGNVVIVVRTALEDRYLQRELPGYADYAQRVRWRLLPGVW